MTLILTMKKYSVMRRSNRNFNIPPPGTNFGHLAIFCARGVGNLICKAFPGWGLDLCLGVVGKIEAEVSGFKLLFLFRALRSPITVNTRLDEME